MESTHWLYPKDITEAKIAQEEMSRRVLLEDCFQKPIQKVAGADISNTPFDPNQMIFAAINVLSFTTFELLETATYSEKQEFPYIPGFLGFREVPALIQAYKKLSIQPDLVMVDGHGISHPKGLGIATHLGVLLDMPTIGVAKSILVGKAAGPLSEEVGSTTPLLWKGKEIGYLLRTKRGCNPLIISAGHKISLTTAVSYVLSCLKKYRLPETTRAAHRAANEYRRAFLKT